MSAGSYNEKWGRGQRHSGEWLGIMAMVSILFAFAGQSVYAQVASPQTASPLTPSGPVTINDFQFVGTGCQPGTLMPPEISDDKFTLTLSYTDYTAEVGVGIAPLEAQKDCKIILNITYPPGYRFGISAVNFKGFASLDTGMIGTLGAKYFFQGQSPQVEFELQSDGLLQFFNDYNVRDEIIATEVMNGPCGGNGTLNINTEVRLQGTGTGAMLADTTTDTFQQIYALVWQQCR